MSFSCVTTSIKQALFIWRLDAWARYLILVLFRSFSLPSYIIRWQSSKILSFLAYVWQKRSILSTKGDMLAYAVSGSDIPTGSLLLTAGNIFSTCIVLQNLSVYWTELTFERTMWVQTVLRFPTNSLCTVELAFKEVQTSAVKNLTHWFAGSYIVNWVEWLWNPSDSFVICFCGPESAQRSKEFLSFWLYWPIKTLH